MKNIHTDNEDSSLNGDEEVTDTLIVNKGGHSLIKCNAQLIQSFNVLKSNVMGHKDRFYERVLSKANVTQDSRSQSLPSSLDDNIKNKYHQNGSVSESCDTQIKLLPTVENDSPPQSPSNDLWFKTWPERCEKLKANDGDDNTQQQTAMNGSNSQQQTNSTLTLNEALQNISLAYSPITKQLHLIASKTSDCSLDNNEESDSGKRNSSKPGHRRNEPGSFSSTISTLSDPSPSGSLLDAEERASSYEESGAKPKRKGLAGFFTKNVFSWRQNNNSTSNWTIFGKGSTDSLASTNSPQHQEYQNIVASSTALIQNIRPSNLPAKDSDEEQRHREEYRAMVAAAKRREAQNSAAKQKQQRLQLQQEESLAAATKHFTHYVLPNWTVTYKTRKTRELWWQGLPSSVRGKVWILAIGNDLNLTQQLYEICSTRAQNRLKNSPDAPPSQAQNGEEIDQESSMDVIQLDIARTFPNLGIFQEGGPFSSVLHSLLAAYVCYRPDVGYVQGMSYIAAILILNMEQYEAFICFANLLNRPLHLAAFTLNQTLMHAYYAAFNEVFNYNLPKLFSHFRKSGLTPDLYLLDWVYTVFAKAMPLDIACRVWDLFLRDGDEFLFRTALGVLHLNQDLLIDMDFLQGAQFLTRLPDDLCADVLFRSVQAVNMTVGKQTFSQIVERCRLMSFNDN